MMHRQLWLYTRLLTAVSDLLGPCLHSRFRKPRGGEFFQYMLVKREIAPKVCVKELPVNREINLRVMLVKREIV